MNTKTIRKSAGSGKCRSCDKPKKRLFTYHDRATLHNPFAKRFCSAACHRKGVKGTK